MEVARARPDGQVLRRHGLEIVIEDIGFCGDDDLECAFLAQEVRGQNLDRRRRGRRPDRPDGASEMVGAAVGEVVAIDRGDDDMGKAQLGDGVGDMLGLQFIEPSGQAGAHVAECAGAGAGVAEDHEGRVALPPTFADVRAARLFADGGKFVLAHDARASLRTPANPAHGRGSTRASWRLVGQACSPFPDVAGAAWR